MSKDRFKCEVCLRPLPGLYCTANVCEYCCRHGFCGWNYICAHKHPELIGIPVGQRIRIVRAREEQPELLPEFQEIANQFRRELEQLIEQRKKDAIEQEGG